MTREEAIRILDPSTTREALAEIEYYAGFNGYEAVIKAVEDACIMAIEALSQPERPKGRWEVIGKTENGANILQCSNCKRIRRGSVKSAFCRDCGAEMER